MIQIDPSIADFLEAPVTVESILCLPQGYADAGRFDEFQAGYRYNAITNESVTGSKPGDFRESWYVICSNYFDDPFFVDFAEADAGFPVYYASHGQGTWTQVPVAKTIGQLTGMLNELSKVAGDAEKAVALINTFPFSDGALWQEAIQSINEAEADL